MAILSTLRFCCCIDSSRSSDFSEKHLIAEPDRYHDDPTGNDLVEELIAKLLKAQKNDAILKADLQSTIHSYGWYDGLAAAMLAALEQAIKSSEEMGPAMKSAYDRAVAGINHVREWAGNHPEMAAVVVTLIALGILAVMMPWLMAWLGFAEEGIVEGML